MKFYTKGSNLLGLIHIILRIILLALLGYASYATSKNSHLLCLIVFYLYCNTFNFSSWVGISHELSHGTFFRTKQLNQLFLKIFGYLTLSNEALFATTHLEHHKNPHGDTDFESTHNYYLNQNSTPKQLLYGIIDIPKLINTSRFIWLNSQGIIPDNRLTKLLENKKTYHNVVCTAREKLIYILFVSLISVATKSYLPIAFLILPNFIGTRLSKNFAMLQHPTRKILNKIDVNYEILNKEKVRIEDLSLYQIRDGLNIRMPDFFEFIYAYMNYHTTHHENPSIPSYHLKNASLSAQNNRKKLEIRINSCMIFKLMFKDLKMG